MRLGMFFTGVSPGGGASNIWTFILGGNLNLSLAMSSISTLASFGKFSSSQTSCLLTTQHLLHVYFPESRLAFQHPPLHLPCLLPSIPHTHFPASSALTSQYPPRLLLSYLPAHSPSCLPLTSHHLARSFPSIHCAHFPASSLPWYMPTFCLISS